MQAAEGRGKLHQAVADGNCTTCHDPHHSTQPSLIRPTAEKICIGCHNPQELPRPEHPVVVRGDCLLCHQGHDSDRVALLRPNIRLRRDSSVATVTSLRPSASAEIGP
jgi:predicted CXXCH cytochrome family protein